MAAEKHGVTVSCANPLSSMDSSVSVTTFQALVFLIASRMNAPRFGKQFRSLIATVIPGKSCTRSQFTAICVYSTGPMPWQWNASHSSAQSALSTSVIFIRV
jgi:hypothetical protein